MDFEKLRHGTELIKRGFARMQKGGVIMDVTNPEQARIAEEAGAVAVMALQAVPADIRKAGGVARMADPEIVQQIIDTVTIPVMAKARIGHFVEAEILEALGVDMVDESEVLTPADPYFHIDKTQFTVPFVCGARNLGEALRLGIGLDCRRGFFRLRLRLRFLGAAFFDVSRNRIALLGRFGTPFEVTERHFREETV